MTDDVIRAFVDAVVPSVGDDATAGATDIAAERYVAHYLGPDRVSRLAAALTSNGSAKFVSSDVQLRTKVILDLRRDPSLRSLIDSAVSLAISAVYGSWSGVPASEMDRAPLGWVLTGYPGPSRVRPEALEG